MEKKNIKLFFIVEDEGPDGIYSNEEIFHDYQEAREHAKAIQTEGGTPLAYIGTVMDAWYLSDGDRSGWNYDDHAHTFNKLYKIDLLKAYQGHS